MPNWRHLQLEYLHRIKWDLFHLDTDGSVSLCKCPLGAFKNVKHIFTSLYLNNRTKANSHMHSVERFVFGTLPMKSMFVIAIFNRWRHHHHIQAPALSIRFSYSTVVFLSANQQFCILKIIIVESNGSIQKSCDKISDGFDDVRFSIEICKFFRTSNGYNGNDLAAITIII